MAARPTRLQADSATEGVPMGFFTGRATFARYRVSGSPPGLFGPDHLEQLEQLRAGRQRLASSDGIEAGWTAGDHILDANFDLAKNVCNDTLHFALRVDTESIPGDLLRAYFEIELQALASTNPSGRPSNRQKREARDSARQRLEAEARDGRYLKRKTFPILWDGLSNELLVGTHSVTQIERLGHLFKQTFERTLEPISAGTLAYTLAEGQSRTRGVDDAQPTVFVPGISPQTIAWVPDERSRDFLGNEFLLWLWFTLDEESDTLKLSDGSEAAIMLARTLTLECPRGVSGKESITSDGPARLPECRRAIQTGKMPRKVGITIVRHSAQYELTLTAETLALGGARFQPAEGESDQARKEERVNQLRHLIETMDLVYEVFCQLRASEDWAKTQAKIQRWLQPNVAAA